MFQHKAERYVGIEITDELTA